jgi:uncharacterized membrane protein
MKAVLQFLKATIAGGFFVLLPVVLVWLILVEAMEISLALVTPFAELLPVEELGGVGIARIVAVLAILLACFVTGALLKAAVGKTVIGWFQRAVLEKIPGYTLIRALTRRFSGTAEGTRFAPAMISTSPGVKEIAFIIEEHDHGACTVLVPLAPTPTIGLVRHVDRAHVTRLNASMGSVVNCIMQWGIGASDVIAQHRAEKPNAE